MEILTNFGASALRELGLWAGVVASVLMAIVWAVPPLILYGLGSGHTTDFMENAMLFCMLMALISCVAALLFVVGAIKNTVSTGRESVVQFVNDVGDTERV